MRTNRAIILVICILVCVLAVSVGASVRQRKDLSSHAIDNREVKRAVFGVKGGFMTAGDAHVGSWARPLRSGTSMGAFFDLRTRSWVSFGLSVESHRVRPEGMEDAKQMLVLSINLMGSYQRDSSRFFVRPCLSFGYGHLPEVGYLPASYYLIMKGTVEALYFPRGLFFGFVGEVGLIGCPLGKAQNTRISDTNITANPRLLLRIGIGFRDLPGL